jgi:hypothetical protein
VNKMRSRQICEGASSLTDNMIERCRRAVWGLVEWERNKLGLRIGSDFEIGVDNAETVLAWLLSTQRRLSIMTMDGVAEVLNPPEVPR